jgi:signal transduction histidine kinase
MLAEMRDKLGGVDPVSLQPPDGASRAPVSPAAEPVQSGNPLLAGEARRQSARNEEEWNVRLSQQVAQQEQVLQANVMAPPRPERQREDGTRADAVSEGVMRPLWLGDALVLARRVSVDGRAYVQGCWLDWPAIRKDLLAQVSDLFDRADLLPAAGADGRTLLAPPPAGLAALPVRLIAGQAPDLPPDGPSALRLSLIVAWVCVLAAAGAFGALLAGVMSLSERRAAFVSSVTHELRTPLTTFRLYTDLLSKDMVSDPEKRRSYLLTLGAEAVRLAHLVENVLAYSRVERGGLAGRLGPTTAGALLEGMRERLEQRVAEAGMRLCVECRPEEAELPLVTDRSAIEQIVFNLVDNACKYAGGAADRRIHIELAGERRHAVLRVRDHGPGIDAPERRRLFKPFSKSAQRAATSAPGVGLGLALSRRLAGQLGGSLTYCPAAGEGAVFALRLPRRRHSAP